MKTKQLGFYCVIFFCLFFTVTASGEERDGFWDIGVGGGLNVDGNPTSQVILVPAYNRRSSWSRRLWYRFEGDLEFLEGYHKVTAVIGAGPFVRWYASDARVRPFVEIGAGVNVITRNYTANKEAGGFLVFSPSIGAGIQVLPHGRPVSVSCRFRHLSNGHVFTYNQSINTLYFILSIGI